VTLVRNPAHLVNRARLRRAPVWLGMAAIVTISWYYLDRMESGMLSTPDSAIPHGVMVQSGGDVADLLMAFGMWALMMLAMMLPAVAPSAAVFSSLSGHREPGRTNAATTSYIVGYAITWLAFAAPAALMQWALTHALLLDGMARSTSTLMNSALLLAAGVYQWMPLKGACLSKCRSPLAFFMVNWRDGKAGAFGVGLRHGGYCVGCCWALMAVMFVVGAMNIAWMGLIMVVVLGEKVIPASWQFDKALGVALVAAGLWLAAGI
jgi:predicted metal-binding membrane protein